MLVLWQLGILFRTAKYLNRFFSINIKKGSFTIVRSPCLIAVQLTWQAVQELQEPQELLEPQELQELRHPAAGLHRNLAGYWG